jgi:hypothetical protein
MLTAKLETPGLGSPGSFLGAETYIVKWKSCPEDISPDTSGLPSIDHALYLFNTVKFHLGQHYRFFDDSAFLQHVNEFYYGNGLEKASGCRLWFAQFLLILAFGNAFLSRSRNPKEPPGAKYFVRAMSLLPDHASLWKDSLLAIEVLALAGLYLYSVDQRESAHVYASVPSSGISNLVLMVIYTGWPGDPDSSARRVAYAIARIGARERSGSKMSRSLVDTIHHGSPHLKLSGSTDVYV